MSTVKKKFIHNSSNPSQVRTVKSWYLRSIQPLVSAVTVKYRQVYCCLTSVIREKILVSLV